MLIDEQYRMSSSQAITSTAVSTNVIDLSAIRNMGVGSELYVAITIVTTLNDSSGTDATVAIALQTDDNEAFSSATATRTLVTYAHGAAAGTQAFFRVDPDIMNERYARLNYTVAAGPLNAGAFTADLVTSIQKWTAYPDAITIS